MRILHLSFLCLLLTLVACQQASQVAPDSALSDATVVAASPRFPTSVSRPTTAVQNGYPGPQDSYPQPTRPPRLVPTASPSASSTVAPSRTPAPPAVSILDISFIDAQHGWLLGTLCQQEPHHCLPVMRVTTDGGQTWQPSSAPQAEMPVVPLPADQTHVIRPKSLHFANARDGWAFGPGLFSTHDGGNTWTDEHRMIVALESVDTTVWMLEQHETGFNLLTSTDLGKTWQWTPNQPPLPVSTAILVRLDTQTAWILTTISSNYTSQLIVTHDGGQTWQQLGDPSASEGWPTRVLAASGDGHLWLLCGGVGAGTMQSKRLYTSNDGGQTWRIAADTPSQGQPIGCLPMSGHIYDPPDGPQQLLTVVSPNDAFLALGLGTLLATHDGGKTWDAAIPYHSGDPRIGPVRFLDSQHGWVPFNSTTLFRTVDGGKTWEEITVP